MKTSHPVWKDTLFVLALLATYAGAALLDEEGDPSHRRIARRLSGACPVQAHQGDETRASFVADPSAARRAC